MTNERLIERETENENWLTDTRVNSIRDRIPPKGVMGPEDCQECGNDIPMERREHGYDLCVGCAEWRERRG